MPDVHGGEGCCIGTTFKIENKIVPNLVGVDIGCGMLTVKLGNIDIDLKKLDEFIYENIPSGRNISNIISDFNIEKLKCFSKLKNIDYLKRSLGSLGGGNHFIEIDKNHNDELYLIIHTGSRNLGKQVADIYQKIAVNYQINKVFNKKKKIKEVIEEYKKIGKEKEIENEIKKINLFKINLPMDKELCYLENDNFNDYMFDMVICQNFASENRNIIARKIVGFLGLNFDELEKFHTIHNYINFNDMILRKGAISAYKNEKVLIPINMKDGCIIGRGKGNEDYNYSAPHGAGRLLSRKVAKETISLNAYKLSMNGIYSTTINENTLDESCFAYKPIETIIDYIKETVDIIEIIKPIYNFKSDEECLLNKK
ncbi:putative uncharacterized protein [Firmicutes bacterium CAG:449]|nr:putative uncharacterized protein [Firmicutes bacterium CAG:449]